MPVNTDFPTPTIKVIFKGLIISAIADGNEFAEIGALVDSRCHKAELIVKKQTPWDGETTIQRFDPRSQVYLEVEGTSRKTIETYQGAEAFNRIEGSGDRDNFRWFVDIEQDLHEGKEYTPKAGTIKPIFRVENALFYTEQLTERRMMIKRGLQLPKLFGKTAEEIAANIYLDQPDSKATLWVDGEAILTVYAARAKDVEYKVVFDCECDITPSSSDFNAVYAAIEPATPAEQQVTFEAEVAGPTVLPANPQVMCIGGNIARLKSL